MNKFIYIMLMVCMIISFFIFGISLYNFVIVLGSL